MNKFIKTSLTAILLTIAAVTFNSSCKKQFDAPPAYVAPSITANTTIRQLKALHTVAGKIESITTDLIIRGIVTGDDKSGNLYKSLVIQDESGGILIRLEGTSLYTTYPIGQEVFVKCKGLFLGDYNNLIQLGGGADFTVTPASLLTLPSALFSQYIVKGSAGNVVVPKSVTVSQLGTSMQDTLQNVLIKLSNFEFAAADTSKTYANATTNPPGTVNFVLKDCGGASITLRNSGFADFAAIGVPNGNGSIVSIYTVFGTTKQLTIRDTADLQMYGARCGGGGGVTPPPSGTTLFSETFESYTASTSVAFAGTGWQNISIPSENTTKTFISNFSSNNSTKVSAFASTQVAANAITSWLITPAISLAGATVTAPKLSFTTAARYTTGTFKIYVSTDYNSSNPPSSATWTQLTATLPTLPSAAFTAFIPSGSISLSSYIGQTIYIGYKYEVPAGTATSAIATYEIDNISVVPN